MVLFHVLWINAPFLMQHLMQQRKGVVKLIWIYSNHQCHLSPFRSPTCSKISQPKIFSVKSHPPMRWAHSFSVNFFMWLVLVLTYKMVSCSKCKWIHWTTNSVIICWSIRIFGNPFLDTLFLDRHSSSALYHKWWGYVSRGQVRPANCTMPFPLFEAF